MTDEPDEIAERDELLFNVRRSVRYHDRRTAFFEFLHRLTNFLTILLAGAVLSELLGSPSRPILQALAGIVALLSAADLVIGFARGADTHRSLKRRFIQLENLLHTGETTKKLQQERLSIEAEETPIYRVLDVLCHNELCTAMGKDARHIYKVPRLKRWTANWLRWPNFAPTALEPCIPTSNEPSDANKTV
jgi:hypothetical protein